MSTTATGGQSATPAEVALYTPRERNRIFVFAFLGTLLDGADFTIFLYFLYPLAQYFHTTLLAISFIQATSYVSGIVGGLVFGLIADRWGRRMGMTLTVLIYSIFQILEAFSPDYNTLLVLRIIGGLAIGGESGIAFSYLNEAMPKKTARRGLWSGLLQTMFIVAGFVAILLYVTTTNAFGAEAWRYAFGLLGVGAFVAFLIRLFMPESKLWLASRQSGTVVKRRLPLRDLFGRGIIRYTVLSTILMTFAFYAAYGVLTYSASMWQQVYKLPATVVGNISYIGTAITIFGYILGGILADKFGRRSPFLILSAIGTGLLLVFIVAIYTEPISQVNASNVFWSLVFYPIVLYGLGYGFFGAWGSWLSELFPTHARSTALNFAYYIGRGVGAGLGPILALLVSTSLNLDVRFAIAFTLVGSLGTLLVTLTLPDTRGSELTAD